MSKKPLPSSVDLEKELFGLIEAVQGYAFISDGIHVLPPERIVDVARASLTHHRQCVKLLSAFVKKYE